MSIDVGDNPVGSVPTAGQKTQIRKAIGCAKVPAVLGPDAALMDTDIFYVFGSNMAYFKDPTSVVSLDVSANTTLSLLNISECTALVDLNANDTNLSLSTVNNILVDLDRFDLEDGIVDLSDGTSAAPSGAAITAVTNLTTKGWTVTTN